MSLSRLSALGLAGCLLLACGGDDDDPGTATGGQAGTAGSSGTSGQSGVGGKSGAGGLSGAAGTGSSGSSGHGGATAGSGGTTGGAAGSTAGTTSAGGANAGGASAGGANAGGANAGTTSAGGAGQGGGTSGAAGDGAAGDVGVAGAAGSEAAGGSGGPSGTSGQSGAGGMSAGAGGSAAGGTSAAGAGGGAGAPSEPVVLLPKTGLTASEIGLIVNDDDPQSVAVAAHYQKVRGIPEAHVYHLSLGTQKLGSNITQADFTAKVQQPLAAKVDASVQAYAVSFSGPNKVDCMSLTSALAFGFDKKYCAGDGAACSPGPGKPTAPSTYYDSASFAPLTDSGLRPAMMLAGTSTENAVALIDRGVAADDTFPDGDGYFIRTTDSARSNARYADFQATQSKWSSPGGPLAMTYLDNSGGKGSNVITDKTDVLFYLTGLTTVPDIKTNTYRPGAVADHLTSFGGLFGSSGQMSVLRWLEAGATGSYGTVIEPCAYAQKFPRASVLVKHYFRGETLVEAYWKSVQWPGEGVFVGEPLARPWGTKTSWKSGTLTIVTTTLIPNKTYAIESAPADSGPWTTVQGNLKITIEQTMTFTVPNTTAAYYRLVAK